MQQLPQCPLWSPQFPFQKKVTQYTVITLTRYSVHIAVAVYTLHYTLLIYTWMQSALVLTSTYSDPIETLRLEAASN